MWRKLKRDEYSLIYHLYKNGKLLTLHALQLDADTLLLGGSAMSNTGTGVSGWLKTMTNRNGSWAIMQSLRFNNWGRALPLATNEAIDEKVINYQRTRLQNINSPLMPTTAGLELYVRTRRSYAATVKHASKAGRWQHWHMRIAKDWAPYF